MPALLSRYATPLTTGLFLVSLISGIGLFFHWSEPAFKGMHEWLSMVLILPFLLHLWRNWRPLTAYLKRPPMAAALGLSMVAAIAFAWPALTGSTVRRAPPQIVLAQALMASTPAELSVVLHRTPEDIVSSLTARGLQATAGKSLTATATEAGKSEREALAALAALLH
ncbi:DUF4405 domain-containing protein [Rhizobium rhizosphaerae]|uniref:DUF4405 domain-containing protein n=1 Tax=Xaviernesmea rhizosphaerae TaxID=1672749 RepID=A0A1Q9ANE3_9HYPH|nr:DUF4405 domain-containing protein [Xaviernesmea rhizosphaerae]OLP56913.1 DUF4405 domain-containing protein [Xaviernesmea rhizosphaerae]